MKKEKQDDTPIATLVIRELKASIKRLYIIFILYFIVSSIFLGWSIYDSIKVRERMNTLLEEVKIIENNSDKCSSCPSPSKK